MDDAFLPSPLTLSDRRSDILSESIVNSAIDMEESLGSLHAILYMRRHNIDMSVAMRVISRCAERRASLAWSTSELGGFADFDEEFSVGHHRTELQTSTHLYSGASNP